MKEQSEFLNQIISQFSNWYQPAADISEATDFFSTSEIVEALNQFHPGAKVNPENVYDMMTNAGYSFVPDPGKMTFQLKWMIIRRA